MNMTESKIALDYARDGFVFPLDIVTEAEAGALRADLERGEAELADDPKRLGLLRGFPARFLPSFDRLVRHPKMVEAAQAVLGPDVMVWGSGLFIKEANTQSYVSWHQDLTYWGLDKAEETTLWVALSPATEESGCMRFIPGSHRERIVPHADSFAADNLLTRGQESRSRWTRTRPWMWCSGRARPRCTTATCSTPPARTARATGASARPSAISRPP